MANAFLLKPVVPASITLAAAGQQPGFDFSGGTLPSGATLTRNSPGTRWNAAGVLVTEAANVARFDYSGGALLGLLVEPTRTNLLQSATDLGANTWKLIGATNSLGGQPDPSGGSSAATVTISSSQGGIYQPVSGGVVANASYAFSCYSRAPASNAATTHHMTINDGQTNGTGFDVARALTAAWGRTGKVGPASDLSACNAIPISNFYGPAPTYDSGVTGAITAWGAQLEAIGAGERSEPSSFIATGGTSATRAADVLSLAWGSAGVPDGNATVRYTFDDGSTQDLASTINSGSMTVPTNLARARIRRADLLSPSVLSTGNSSPSVGAMTNLLVDYAGIIAQTTCSTGNNNAAIIVVDLGVDTVLDTALMFGVELFPQTGTLIVDYATSAQGQFTGGYATDTSGAAYAGSASMTSGKGVSFWALGQPVTARYLRFTYAAGTNMPGYSIRASRLVIGKRIQLGRNFGYGASFGARDLGSVDFSRRGVLLRVRGSKLRTVQLTFSNIRKDEVEATTKPLLEQLGNTDMVALVTDPTADPQRQNRCYYGPLVGDLAHTWRNAAAWETKINVVSAF